MSTLRTVPVLLLATMLAAWSSARGDEPPTVQADLTYASRYVFRGVVRADSSAQAGVEFNRDQFSGGVWTNLPLQGGGAREVNLHAAYAWHPVQTLTLEAGVEQVWLAEVPGGGLQHSFEAGLTATLPPVMGCIPRLSYYHDLRLRSDTTQIAVARSIALTRLGAFLELDAFAGWATGDDWRPDAPGPWRHDSYGYWGGAARVPYRIGLHSTLVAGIHYADAFGRSALNGPFGRSTRRNCWITLGVSLDF